MARKAKTIPVTIKGYGEEAGTEHTLEFAGVEGDRIILNFVNPLNREQYITVPFRASDGFAVGHKPGGGYRIPKSVRQELTEKAASGKLDTEDVAGEKPRKAGMKMKVKVAGAKSTESKAKMKLPAVSKNGTAKEKASAGKTASAKSAHKPVKSMIAAKENVKGKTTEEKRGPGRRPSIERPEVGKREMQIKLSAGVYEELSSSKKLGPELKAAVKAAVKDGAYLLVVLNKETAATLMEVFSKLSGSWSGVRGARLREGAKRIAGEINERFRVKVPAELTNGGSTAKPEAKKAVKPKAKAKPVEDDEEDDEEEASKPKVKKTGKKSKKG